MTDVTSEHTIPIHLSTKLYDSMIEFSDVTFKFGDKIIEANRCIIIPQSDYFRGLLKMHNTNIINITTTSYNAFRYIILLTYNKCISNGTKNISNPHNNVSDDTITIINLTDDELFESINLLNSATEKELLDYSLDIYYKNSENLPRLCESRKYVTNTYQLQSQIITIIQNNKNKYTLSEFTEDDAKFLLEKISVDILLNYFGIEILVCSNMTVDQIKYHDITKCYYNLTKIYSEDDLLNRLFQLIEPKIEIYQGKYLIKYQIFNSHDKYEEAYGPSPSQRINIGRYSVFTDASSFQTGLVCATGSTGPSTSFLYRLPLIKGKLIYHINNKCIKTYVFEKMDVNPFGYGTRQYKQCELNTNLERPCVTMTNGKTFSGQQLKELYYFPSKIILCEYNC